MKPLSVQSVKGGCRGPAASYAQRLTPGQFAAWYLTLVLSRRGIQGNWSRSLTAKASDNLWLAVCSGACVVRPRPLSLPVCQDRSRLNNYQLRTLPRRLSS
jgi:hypothetical protein